VGAGAHAGQAAYTLGRIDLRHQALGHQFSGAQQGVHAGGHLYGVGLGIGRAQVGVTTPGDEYTTPRRQPRPVLMDVDVLQVPVCPDVHLQQRGQRGRVTTRPHTLWDHQQVPLDAPLNVLRSHAVGICRH